MVALTVRLFLVRHGSTAWSESRRYTGLTDIELSDLGRKQASGLRQLTDHRWTAVWSSDLKRAVDTACLAGFDAATDERLREIDFGVLEGKSFEDLDLVTQAAIASFDDFAPPGGESVTALRARLADFIADLPPGDHLVFTHGGVIRALMREIGATIYPRPGELVILCKNHHL